MEESTDLMLRVYERASQELRSFDARIGEHLSRLLEAHGILAVRDLAFLEGLRSERDEAFDALREAETSLSNYLLSRLDVSQQAPE